MIGERNLWAGSPWDLISQVIEPTHSQGSQSYLSQGSQPNCIGRISVRSLLDNPEKRIWLYFYLSLWEIVWHKILWFLGSKEDPIPASFLGALFGILASLVWGSSDFSGGLASRRQDAYRVLLLASISGQVALVALTLIFGENLGTPADIAWSAAAGAFGALGIVMLYAGLAVSGAALVAPTAAVVGAVLPILVGIATEGLPAVTRMVGFILGVFGIWLTSASSPDGGASGKTGLGYAIAAGLGFGGFFILISRVSSGAVFAPLVVARSVAVLVALVILLVRRMPLPALTSNPLANLAGAIDAVGNVFYLLATRYTRLDIAVILSSMYPAVTVLLSSRVLHERISLLQWLGVGLCVLAVVLIVV